MSKIDIKAAIAYNSKRPYTREQWQAIGQFRGPIPLDAMTPEHFAASIAAYQKRHGLAVDGKLGPKTEARMVADGLVLPCPDCGRDVHRPGPSWCSETHAPTTVIARSQDKEAADLRLVADALADALSRMLWRSVADEAECTCEDEDDTCPECQAWRALGLGQAWPGATLAEEMLLEATSTPTAVIARSDDHDDHFVEALRYARKASSVTVPVLPGDEDADKVVAKLADGETLGRNDGVARWAIREAKEWPERDPHIRRTYVAHYWGYDDALPNWCGAFVATAIEADGLEVPVGVRQGAKRITRWCAGAHVSERIPRHSDGQWVVSPDEVREASQRIERGDITWYEWASQVAERLRPGDVICWHRGRESWQGHVAVIVGVAHGELDLVGGNEYDSKMPTGKRSGQVVRRQMGPHQWATRLKGLYGVARP